MKKFVSKVQSFGQKAAQIQQAIQGVPPKIAELREAVALTTGELQQLRADVQAGVTGLIAHDTAGLSLALKEINGATEVFAQAGYALAGLELELSPSQRLTVRLAREEERDAGRLKALIAANQPRRTVSALLNALLRAEEMAGSMEVTGLQYEELAVHIGPSPVVRMCWRPEADVEEVVPPVEPAAIPVAPVTPAEQPSFAPGSFFERRPAHSQAPTEAPASPALPVAPSSPGGAVPAPAASEVGAEHPKLSASPGGAREMLERFKKNPHFSKYAR